MSAGELRASFARFVAAEDASDRVWLDYKFGRASEADVRRAQRLVAKAKSEHLAAINEVDS